VETDVSGYAMEAVLMEGGRLVCYHSKVFHGAVLNYPTYDKELYAMVQVVKKWNHYLMGKLVYELDHSSFVRKTHHCEERGNNCTHAINIVSTKE